MSGVAQVILIVAIAVSLGFAAAAGIVYLALRRRNLRAGDPHAVPFADSDHRAAMPFGSRGAPILCRPLIRGDHVTCVHCGDGPCLDGGGR